MPFSFGAAKAALTIPMTFVIAAAGFCAGSAAQHEALQDKFIQFSQFGDALTHFEFNLQNLRQEKVQVDGEQYDRLWLPNEETPHVIGEPDFPVIARFMLIPPESGVELRIQGLEARLVEGLNPMPVQPVDDGEVSARRLSDPGSGQGREFVCLKTDLAKQTGPDGFWPTEIACLGRPAILRGYRILPILISPVRYNPQTGEVQVVESLEFDLDFTSEQNRVNLVVSPDRPRPSQYAERIVRELVLNPPPLRDTPPAGGSILYVMGNWNDIGNELAPLVEWRRRMGWSVNVVRVASSDAQANKNAILQAYNGSDPPEHVVIVGDTDGNYPRGFFDMRRGAQWPYETDHLYAELEGDDVLPECSIGRLVFESSNRLRGIVEKIISYEREPYIGEGNDFGWQKRCLFMAGDSRSGLSSIDVCRWIKDMALRNGFTNASELYWSAQAPQPNGQAFITNGINAGCSIFLYRGWTFMSGFAFGDVDGLRNRRMLPFVMLATCNTGDYGEHVSSDFYYTERFSYLANGGAIGAVGASGATHTAYNNLISASTFKAFIADGVWSQGWAVMKSKVDLYRHYADRGDIQHFENNGLQAWLCELYIFNLMGDPVVDLFTDIPAELDVTRPAVIRTGETSFGAAVNYVDGGEPAVDALVCLYKPEVFQLVKRTDAEGRVEFDLDPEWTQDGQIKFTVTGHNLLTVCHDYEIQQPEMYIGCGGAAVDDDQNGESNGDGDGIANPLETLELTVQVVNFGQGVPQGELNLTLESLLPQLEVLEAANSFDAAPEPGEAVDASFVARIGGGFHNGANAVFRLTATAGEESWFSMVMFPVEAPDLELQTIDWTEGVPRAGDIKPLRITLKNVGARPSPQMNATLVPLVRTVGAPQAQGVFPAIEPNQTARSEAVFRLSPNPMHLSEIPADVAVVLTADNGLRDTARFSFKVVLEQANQPFGPDDYGYMCFDNTDEGWDVTPTYNWIEINPAVEERAGDGVNTQLQDVGEEHDVSTVVHLPFTFTYYGEDFDRITICSNGWASLGDHHELITARNRRIPAGMVGSGMLCPFWDDLITTREGGIFTWFYPDSNFFIIEWSQMRKLGPRGANEPLETFEIILKDPEVYPTFSGDGDIVFQYRTVTDDQSAFQEWDTPFATVGIGSVDQTDGLEYTYWGARHPGAAPLVEGRAILFTTMIQFDVGVLDGHVIDVLSGNPVEGVTITTTYGFTAVTDTNGYYLIPQVLVDTTMTYEATASKMFYNDTTVSGIIILPDSTVTVDFGILRPVFSLGIDRVDIAIEQNNVNDFYVPFRNAGTGPLMFSSKIEFRDVKRDNPYDSFMLLNISDAPVGTTEEGDTIRLGNKKVNGVCFVDSLFYVCAGGSDRINQWPEVYRFTRNGEFVDSLVQPWLDNNGIRGFAFDGANLWGGFNHYLYKLDPQSIAVRDSFQVPPTRPLDVAYDPATGTLYTLDTTQPIFAYDTLGNAVTDSAGQALSWSPTWQGSSLRKYGLAWYSGQPDGYNLLVFANVANQPSLFGLNPLTGALVHLCDFGDSTVDQPRGIDVTDRWNSSVWTLILSYSNENSDWVGVYELEPNATWFSYSPAEGRLEAGEETTLHMRLESGERRLDRYWLDLVLFHSADSGRYEIPVVMSIVEHSQVPSFVAAPREFGMEPNFPNPFNPNTTLRFNIDEAGLAKLTVYDINGRMVREIHHDWLEAGQHEAALEGVDLAAGVYIVRLECNGRNAAQKIVLMK